MNAYIHTMTVTDENGEESIFYPRTKQEAVEGLEERLAKLEVADITETEDTTLENSNAGRLLFTEIKGAMEQGENPSPTNPQEIRNVLISGIKTHGKNILDMRNAKGGTYSGITVEMNDDGSYSYTGTSTGNAVNVFMLGSYASEEVLFTLTKGTYFVKGVNLYYNRTSIITTGREGGILTLDEDTPIGGVRAVASIVGTSYNETHYPIIAESDVEIPWEPYTETSITFSQPIELYGKDDVRDILTSKQIKRKYVKRVWNGSEDWTSASTSGRYYTSGLGCKGYGNVMCSHASKAVGSTEIVNTCYLRDTSNGRFIINTEFATLDEWKAHLQTNPMTVVHEMAEETTEELPIADQIALNSLQTFDGITHTEFISEIKPTFSAKYGTTEMGGMTLESLLTARSNDLRLSAVESAVVNNI